MIDDVGATVISNLIDQKLSSFLELQATRDDSQFERFAAMHRETVNEVSRLHVDVVRMIEDCEQLNYRVRALERIIALKHLTIEKEENSNG